jgi:hypothetical protein
MTLKNKYTIAQGIKRLAGKQLPQLYLAECISLQKSTYRLTVSVPALGFVTQINYHPATSNVNRYTLWPRVGSMVVLGRLEGSDQLFVLSVINPEVVELNGAQFSAVKGETLRDEVNKLKATVDALLAVIRGTPIPEPGNSAPSALQIALNTAASGQTTGSFTNILNTEVKHG